MNPINGMKINKNNIAINPRVKKNALSKRSSSSGVSSGGLAGYLDLKGLEGNGRFILVPRVVFDILSISISRMIFIKGFGGCGKFILIKG